MSSSSTAVPDGLTQRDLTLRHLTYTRFVEFGRAPTRAEMAEVAGWDESAVVASWRRLGVARGLVVDEHDELRMVIPFAASPTAHRVRAAGRDWYANCAWDAFGVCALLGVDGEIVSTCPDCGEDLHVSVRDGQADGGTLRYHCLVPAASWWKDIEFT